MPSLPQPGSKLVTVSLGAQLFSIDIMSVREIRGWTASTPLAHAPDYVLGMINLRGTILPVVDLAARLGLGKSEPTASSVVVVVQLDDRQAGLMVDAVCDIATVAENMLQEPPEVGGGNVRDFVYGVMSTEEGIVSLLRLDNLLPDEVACAA
jgi:purine-binding chemotaxis protein CheW